VTNKNFKFVLNGIIRIGSVDVIAKSSLDTHVIVVDFLLGVGDIGTYRNHATPARHFSVRERIIK
jgi:hypothetical protein